MTAFVVVVCGVLGLLVGSFLNVVIWRVPRDESVVKPRSRCPQCGNELRNADNVPVVSWLLLRGRCRFCGTPISARYPIVELLTGVLFALLALRFAGEWAVLPAYLVLGAGLVALSAIDMDVRRLPVKVLYPTLLLMSALFVVAAVVDDEWDDLAEAVVGGAIGFVVLYVIAFVQPKGMGFGDVRLAGLLGVAEGWLSLGHVAVGLFLGFFSGAVIGIVLMALKLRTRKDMIPFGPFLALGALLAVFAGTPLLDWYSP